MSLNNILARLLLRTRLKCGYHSPVTIYDKALKQAFKNGTGEQFYAQKLIEMNNSIAYKRYLLGKELINRVLTDDMGESADRYTVVSGVGAIEDKEDALKVWATLRKIIAAFGVNTTKYNKRPVTVPSFRCSG